MEWPDPTLVVRIAGALITLLAGGFTALYVRKLGVDAAEGRRATVQANTIETLQTEVHSVRRMLDTHVSNVVECEKRLAAAERALAKWDNMLGRIWVREFDEDPES